MSETVKDADTSACTHCWHWNGQRILVNGTETSYVCCHCSAAQTLTTMNSTGSVAYVAPKHGPFAPKTWVLNSSAPRAASVLLTAFVLRAATTEGGATSDGE